MFRERVGGSASPGARHRPRRSLLAGDVFVGGVGEVERDLAVGQASAQVHIRAGIHSGRFRLE